MQPGEGMDSVVVLDSDTKSVFTKTSANSERPLQTSASHEGPVQTSASHRGSVQTDGTVNSSSSSTSSEKSESSKQPTPLSIPTPRSVLPDPGPETTAPKGIKISTGMSFFSQVGLLLWKNMLLQRRKWCVSIFEIFIPIVSAAMFLFVRHRTAMMSFHENQLNTKIHEHESLFHDEWDPVGTLLGYTPNTAPINKVMQRMFYKIGNAAGQNSSLYKYKLSPKGFKTENELVKYFTNNSDTMQMALVFRNLPEGATPLPLKINCFFRLPTHRVNQWKTADVFPALYDYSWMEKTAYSDNYGGWLLFSQAVLTEALIEEWNNLTMSSLDVVLQRTPTISSDISNPNSNIIDLYLKHFIAFTLLLSVMQSTKAIVYEKEKGIKEAMKLMGLKLSAHWTAWFLTCFMCLVFSVTVFFLLICLGVVNGGPALAHSSATLFYVLLLCYATTAAVISGVLYICLNLIYIAKDQYENITLAKKLFLFLNFNNALAFGTYIIGKLENSGAGAQWSTIHKPVTDDKNANLLNVMMMMLINTAFQFAIAWYIDNICPGKFGVPKPFYFCFTKSYWCGSSALTDRIIYTGGKLEDDIHFENDPGGFEEGVNICNLHKCYGKKVAVDNVSLRMYKEQITVLLGHNGAGKTTTMSMLTGFIPPTSGTAYVNGLDIRKDIDAVRTSLGLCPQHNILFDSLTVKEHLTFFAKLKGCPGNYMKEEVRNMIQQLGLAEKETAQAGTLSGGLMRKLCVGIALINKSKVVILDEPTSGMDLGACRQTWDVLQRNRAGRTILLTTNHMDEADVLGDRIAFMAEGVVKCCGTSLFLKNLYGAGYHLIIVQTSTCEPDKVTQLVQSCVPAAQFENEMNAELTYLLPDNQSPVFPTLFHSLESQKEELGVRDYGVTFTALDEVFLKVGISSSHEADKVTNLVGTVSTVDGVVEIRKQPSAQPMGVPENSADADVLAFSRGYTKLTGTRLILSQLRGMIMKKVILLWRQRIVVIVQLLVPVLHTVWVLYMVENFSHDAPEPPLSYNLTSFGATIIPYASDSPDTEKITDLYKSQFGADQTTRNVKPPLSMSHFMLRTAKEIGIDSYRRKVIIGAEFNKSPGNTKAISYYSGLPYHARPISLAYTLNALAKYFTNHSGFDIQMGLHPFPGNEHYEMDGEKSDSTVSTLLCLGMAFFTSSFAHSLIKERAVGAKHMQMVCGANILWLGTFIVDFINYLILVGLLIAVIALLNSEAYAQDGRLGIVLPVLLAYGWAVLPFTYLLQFIFTRPATGVIVCISLNGFLCLMSTNLIHVIEWIETEKDTAENTDWAFLVFFPHYCLGCCFTRICYNYVNRNICITDTSYKKTCLTMSNRCCKGYGKGCGDSPCIEFTDNYLGWELPGIGRYMLFMVIQGVVYMAFVLVVDSKLFHLLCNTITSVRYQESHFRDSSMEDDDVAAERLRINASPASVLCQQESLLLVNLYRQFGTLVAVDHTCLGVPERECFGLLGQNGAGKTTTFRMLTGDKLISGGNAYVKGYGVKQNITKVHANLGYCPQFDALLEEMTGRETLTMYARFRGVPETNIKDCVNSLMDVLLLRPHADNRSGNYSCGIKRKLSIGIALIGDPPIIMLDEPSRGMDPAARRQLWNVLSGVRASGRTMVLTSHSMEECEALCTRLAIMVNGQFMSLGSTQHLKSKFGQGYILEVKMKTLECGILAPVEPVVNSIRSWFPSAQLIESHVGYMLVKVSDPEVYLGRVFEVMENSKWDLRVQSYQVHQTSLEHVFLALTKRQHPIRTDEKS